LRAAFLLLFYALFICCFLPLFYLLLFYRFFASFVYCLKLSARLIEPTV